MCRCATGWWPLFLSGCLLIAALTTFDYASPGFFIFLGCMLALIVWYWANFLLLNHGEQHQLPENEIRESQNTRTRDIESEFTYNSLSMIGSRFMISRVMAPRQQHYRQEARFFPFAPKAHIARLAMRALPPTKSFNLGEDKTTESERDCAICMEEFKIGELIQPFGVCVHEFHSSCVNSWLHSGKTTCPICREELSIAIH
ncbi:receptor homology region, transmembrane domain- and RING domain-containing protein 1-like [Abrus precatorius]|uniref:Receptor homology region, transmembrane domain- and RING domain-containing protein 1-like n=1 Tax=Abrus precatorius TaxID=3816 RepID=A0A8B8LGT9_ABRPR|nr:receptor homology region, transmembrane domain- and RING domain-containing protein 1-like [Abrus precatorius]